MKKLRVYTTIRGKIITLIVILVSFTVLLLSFYATFNLYAININSRYETMDTTMNAISSRLDEAFTIINNTSISIAESESIRNWLDDNDYFDSNERENFKRRSSLEKELNGILAFNNVWSSKLIKYIVIINDGTILSETYTIPQSILQIENESLAIYDQTKDDYNKFIHQIPPSSPTDSMFLVKKLQSDFDSKNQLVMIIAVDQEAIREMYSSLTEGNDSIIIISDINKRIFSSNIEEIVSTQMANSLWKDIHSDNTESPSDITYNDKNYVLVNKDLKVNKFIISYLYPKANIFEQTISSMSSFVIVLILISITSTLTIFISTSKSTRFINDFVLALNSVEESNYEVQMSTYNNKSLDELVVAFNNMTSKTKNLIKTTYESKLLLNDMKLKFLQYQMNPHFLFNILLTIQIKAKMSGNDTVADMINSLSSLLRASISGDDRTYITLSEELEYVKYYLHLQKLRFEDRMNYEININDIDQDLCIVPKLIIEPIVENAIIHGIESIDCNGFVSIHIEKKQSNLYIKVSDNGIGFEANHDELFSEIHIDVSRKKDKVGLYNTNQRIKLLYGREYGVSVESQKHVGTVVLINIPYNKSM